MYACVLACVCTFEELNRVHIVKNQLAVLIQDILLDCPFYSFSKTTIVLWTALEYRQPFGCLQGNPSNEYRYPSVTGKCGQDCSSTLPRNISPIAAHAVARRLMYLNSILTIYSLWLSVFLDLSVIGAWLWISTTGAGFFGLAEHPAKNIKQSKSATLYKLVPFPLSLFVCSRCKQQQ